MEIKIILLDIGGVLVEFSGVKRMIELMENKITTDEFLRRWQNSKYVNLYESGRCSTETFADGVVKELNMNIEPDDYIKEFPFFVQGFFPGAIELLQTIKQNYTIACLSNANIIQWNGLCDRVSIDKYFHYNFLSFEMGKLKPELETYKYVIEQLNCNPDSIAFFDDNEANVKAGINAGMNAYRVKDFIDLKSKLERLNLL